MAERVGRRRFLLAAGSSVALAGCPARRDSGGDVETASEDRPEQGGTATDGRPTETPAANRHGLGFRRVVNAVDDLGFDDTGSEPIDEAFDAAYRTGTLIEFPPGEYLVDGEHAGAQVSHFGIRGTGNGRRDVVIRPTEGSRLKWLKAVEAGPHLVENLSFDERSDDSTQLSLWIESGDGSVIRNVEWLGRTPDDSGYSFTLAANCLDVDGVFTIDRIFVGLDQPAKAVQYPDGVTFLRGGEGHNGEVILRNAVIHNRNSSAMRYTKPTGVLTVEGGEFVNNQNANIRFGAGDHPTKVSSAVGSFVRVDSNSAGTSDAIRVDASSQGYSGAVFRHIAVQWLKPTGRGVIALPGWGGHGSAEFYDCVVHNDGADTPTVMASAVPNGPGTVRPEETAVVIDNGSFTGSGRGFIEAGRPGSVIRDSCIHMPNATISGFETRNLSNSSCRLPRQR